MDNTLYYGSICITDLMANLNEKHSAFTKGNNGKIYCNINVWTNATPDKFGNSMSLLLSSKKDVKDKEGKQYIGNCKLSEYDGPKPIDDKDVAAVGKNWANQTETLNDHLGPQDDMPF